MGEEAEPATIYFKSAPWQVSRRGDRERRPLTAP